MKFGKIFIVFLLLAFISTSASFAQTTTSAGLKNPFERIKEAFSISKASQAAKREAVKEKVAAKLDQTKLRVCQVKEKVITTRQNSLTRLTENIFDKFTAIATRVEEFYKNKVVPSGKTVSNYDELVANVDAKKTAAQSALKTAKTDSANFSCTSEDPKGALTTFRTDMQNVKKALKDYRTAIKDLIVAVRSVVGEENASPSPTPTPTP